MREKPNIMHKSMPKSNLLTSLTLGLALGVPHAVYGANVVGNSITEEDLQKAMKKFCVPKDQFNCMNTKLAKWNREKQKCICDDAANGAIWNPTTRECFTCTAGTYLKSETDTSCTPCPAGYRCAGKNAQPVRCIAGTYNRGVGNSNCYDCLVGNYCTGGDNIVNCPAGTYQNLTGQSICKSCPTGQYSNNGAASCMNCPSTTSIDTPHLVLYPGQGSCQNGTLYPDRIYTVVLRGGHGNGRISGGGSGGYLAYRFKVAQTASIELCAGGDAYVYGTSYCVGGGGGAGSWLRVNYDGIDRFFVAGGGGGGGYDWASGGGGGGIGAGGAGGDEKANHSCGCHGGNVGPYAGGSTTCGKEGGWGGAGYQVNGARGPWTCAVGSGGAGGGGGGGSGPTRPKYGDCGGYQYTSSNEVRVRLFGKSFSEGLSFGGQGRSGDATGGNGRASHTSNITQNRACTADTGCAALYMSDQLSLPVLSKCF